MEGPDHLYKMEYEIAEKVMVAIKGSTRIPRRSFQSCVYSFRMPSDSIQQQLASIIAQKLTLSMCIDEARSKGYSVLTNKLSGNEMTPLLMSYN